MSSVKVVSVCPGTNHVDGMPRRASIASSRFAPTRGPNSACENFTGLSPRRTESEMAS